MVAKDTIIGIVGAVILVAALVGVFYLEGSQGGAAGGTPNEVSWTDRSLDGPELSGETEEGSSTNDTLPVPHGNLTTFDVVLTWTDDIGDPDRFRLTVTSPDGALVKEAEGESGRLNVTFPDVNTVPPETTVYGDSEDDARSKVAQQHTRTRGMGNWTVTIELVDAGDFSPIPGGPPAQEDTSNTWELTSEITVYEPELVAG